MAKILQLPHYKVHETFHGYVDAVYGEIAYILLESVEHGDTLYGEYPIDKLNALGIHEGTSFLCKVKSAGIGTSQIELSPLPPNPISDELAQQIKEECERLLSFDPNHPDW